MPTRSRSGFASPRGGSLKPPGAPILEKDVAKAESGGGAKTRSDLDVVASARLPDMPNGGRLKVGGIVLMRQRPCTANGITFVTLEDETGQVNLIVRKATWERDRRVARGASAMIAHGTLQREKEVIHVLVTRLEDLSDKLADLETRSRDFR